MLIEAIQSLKSKLHQKLNNDDNRAKIQDADFVAGLLQSIARARGNFTLGSLRLAVCMTIGTTIGRSSFNERVGTASLIEHSKLALETLIKSIRSNDSKASQQIGKKLGVEGVIGVDGSLVSLWDGLKAHFKGTFTTASLKLHLAVDLVTGALSWYDLTSGSTHDSQRFPDIERGFLYIFDLGYWSLELFKNIQDQDGFFLSRVKGSANLTVSKIVSGWIGKNLIGSDLLSSPIFRNRGNIVELSATLSNAKIESEVRVIGFWNKQQKKYHWYVTNLTAPRGLIYELYRLRWQVELCFKSMKSTLNFDQIPTLNPNAVLSFSLLTLCNFVMTSIVRAEADYQQKNSSNLTAIPSIQQAGLIFREIAGSLYSLVRIRTRISKKKIAQVLETILPLLTSAFDPNSKNRKTTAERLYHA